MKWSHGYLYQSLSFFLQYDTLVTSSSALKALVSFPYLFNRFCLNLVTENRKYCWNSGQFFMTVLKVFNVDLMIRSWRFKYFFLRVLKGSNSNCEERSSSPLYLNLKLNLESTPTSPIAFLCIVLTLVVLAVSVRKEAGVFSKIKVFKVCWNPSMSVFYCLYLFCWWSS